MNGYIPSGDSQLFVPHVREHVHLIHQILSNLHGDELLKQRSICKVWNNIIAGISRVTFKVRNNEQSIQLFKTLSTPYKSFQFEGLDLEAQFFGDADFFRKFSLDFCLRIDSLSFSECELPTGRFFELLAFCRKLRKLVIRMSPTILEPDMGILHWGFCFKHVQRCLAKLTFLSVRERKIPEKALHGLAYDTKVLTTLQIGIIEGFLPVYSIGKILHNNANTLRCLALRGKVHPCSSASTGLFPVDLPTMKNLQTLILIGQNFVNMHVEMMGNFLNKCPLLSTLNVNGSTIGKTTLSSITDKLTKLSLLFNKYDKNAFKGDNFPNLRSLKLAQGPCFEGSTDAFEVLLLNTYSKLRTLELKTLIDGGNLLKRLMKVNYPQLTTLALTECINIAGPPIRHIFTNLNYLTSLSITNCPEIDDGSLCPTYGSSQSPSLADMKDLQFLDLSGTQAGNQTVSQCIVTLSKLENVNLNSTKVTQVGALMIIKSLKQTVRKIYAMDLPNPTKLEDFKRWANLAPEVDVQCTIESAGMSHGIVTITDVG